MTVVASESWVGVVGDEPVRVVVALSGIVAITVLASALLRIAARRTRALQHQVLMIVFVGLTLGATIAVALSWLMVLDRSEVATVVVVLIITASVATILIAVAMRPLRSDLDRLERTVRRMESGDRAARTSIERPDELGHVARALDELNERLDSLEREREHYERERTVMLSSISHDLRTPLSALRAAVEALADGVVSDPARYHRAMQRDIDALTSLVDDLFLLVRVQDGRFELQPCAVDLTEVADEAIEALAPVAAAADVHLLLVASTRVRVEGNAAALGRVIRNLVDNAIRFAPARSTVTVEIDDDGGPCVRVVDTGPGFPATFAEHAFEEFSRPDPSRTRETGGTGLGLAIARGLVEAHGGRIWIEDPPGGRVVFALPAG
jgi:signal transduction histidine kinase